MSSPEASSIAYSFCLRYSPIILTGQLVSSSLNPMLHTSDLLKRDAENCVNKQELVVPHHGLKLQACILRCLTIKQYEIV